MSEENSAEKDAPIASNGTSSTPTAGAVDATPQSEVSSKHSHENDDGPTAKRVKLDNGSVSGQSRGRGVAAIKKEYLVDPPTGPQAVIDDDAAEASIKPGDDATEKPDPRGKKGKKGKKPKGQNKDRTYGTFHDALKLCNSVAFYPEFSPRPCKFGDRCNMTHDLRKYLKEGRRGDLETLGGKCHIYETFGRCSTGWRCRFVHSHMNEIEHEDGRKELVLISDSTIDQAEDEDVRPGTVNVVSAEAKLDLAKKRTTLKKSDTFIKWLETEIEGSKKLNNQKKDDENRAEKLEEIRASFVEPPLKPSEKRRVYFGRETPVLAPLTTQGNLPFRRLCVELGAQVTFSEMAMALPIVQGQKSEWALMKAHETEVTPPRFRNSDDSVVKIYDNSRDLKFGAQISGHQPWVVTKATEALTTLLPHLRVVDLNCGCPIDMVYQNGAGSALLDVPSKLEKMVRGMNTVSGEVPITVKLRTGVRDGKPTADKIIERMAFGARETRDRLGAPGCAAVTLHGRSRQQRYLKSANWSYIAECAALIKSYNDKKDELTDTMNEADESTLANSKNGKLYFIGNGDCYSHVEYFNNIENSGVDTVMIARGAMIKPWVFEEIEKGQYLDKSASERLGYIEKFVRYGLENWGSDELGIGFTRRFLLEWLSFTCRYIPVGLLEHLPPSLRERPPAYRGRNDLETLLASNNYKDWIKISEMFLGPAHPGFHFQPKHKSNSYEMEAEG